VKRLNRYTQAVGNLFYGNILTFHVVLLISEMFRKDKRNIPYLYLVAADLSADKTETLPFFCVV
jgi:hypothetical protein